jgi:hypothetical protein
VWLGVPETGPAVIVAGAIVGVAAMLPARAAVLRSRAAAVVGVLPVLGAVLGAAGERHALAGGLLCSTTLVLLAPRRRIVAVSAGAVATATLLQLAAATVAGRHVGVARDWGGSLRPAALVVAVSAGAAATLRRDQGAGP